MGQGVSALILQAPTGYSASRLFLGGDGGYEVLPITGEFMADLYLKNLESERKALWATCRLKGLPRDTPERMRIAQIDEQIAAHKAKKAEPKT
ncbi:hypothetical protein GRI39_08070 [Altererythrobacter indicus]|uniref:Uncharacterized protein n=1 Tax=Altericroceibacterium indicum TaxID=374177 RepID=A0A845ABS3_9SPHN|nr:hypothetical protein [Altericroceibacterium indicum]MXP25996.1 hypothetical protein [Altericroceibacterium indicum]